jgi:hypothetical protein
MVFPLSAPWSGIENQKSAAAAAEHSPSVAIRTPPSANGKRLRQSRALACQPQTIAFDIADRHRDVVEFDFVIHRGG